MKRELERIEFPADMPALAMAEERVDPFVRRAAMLAQWGTLNLKELARDVYLQGVYDGAQVAATQPQVMALFKAENQPESSSDPFPSER